MGLQPYVRIDEVKNRLVSKHTPWPKATLCDQLQWSAEHSRATVLISSELRPGSPPQTGLLGIL